MTTKTLIAVAAAALMCVGSPALAKTKHHAKHTAPAQPQQVAAVPGNNPMANPKPSAPITGAQAPSAVVGNNPMKVK